MKWQHDHLVQCFCLDKSIDLLWFNKCKVNFQIDIIDLGTNYLYNIIKSPIYIFSINLFNERQIEKSSLLFCVLIVRTKKENQDIFMTVKNYSNLYIAAEKCEH